MINRIMALAQKELRQLRRDSRMLFVLFAFPLILLVIIGYAISMDVKHIQVAIYDREKSDISRSFIHSLSSSEYFDVITYINNPSEIRNALDQNIVQSVIVIPEDLSEKYYSNKEAKIQVLVDGVNANTASIVLSYSNLAISAFSQNLSKEIVEMRGVKSYVPVMFEPIFWYNPSLNSTFFLIPGLIAMILIITAVVSISLSIVREKEKGTMEQILVSPVNSFELIIGKTIPYVFISLSIGMLIVFLSYIMFGLVVKGSLFLLLITTLIFLFASLTLGIFVSSISENQQVAFQIATIISMLPSMILSGFIFPIESMPWPVQILTNITPSKYYLKILKDIILKGVGLEAFWDQIIYMILFSAFFLMISMLKNRKTKIAQ